METCWTWDRRFAFGTSRRGIRIHWIANALLELEEKSLGKTYLRTRPLSSWARMLGEGFAILEHLSAHPPKTCCTILQTTSEILTW
jgi:hypothetical protein